jgi:hypothetical protein
MRSRSHLGITFKVWNGQQTWLWFVADGRRKSGTIGATATEAEAVHEACRSIEKMVARAETRGLMYREAVSSTTAICGWNDLLANLERYLTSVCMREHIPSAMRK